MLPLMQMYYTMAIPTKPL